MHTVAKKKRGRPSLGGLPSIAHFLSDAQKLLWADDRWCQKYKEKESNVFATRFNNSAHGRRNSSLHATAPVNGLDYCAPRPLAERWAARDRVAAAQIVHRVKVRGYATDRLKVVSYPSAVKPLAKRMTRAKLAAEVRGTNKFSSRSKVRRRWLIGGKRRDVPRFTSWTTNARDYVRDAASCIEKYSKGVCYFATFTIPGRTENAVKVISAGSGYIQDRFTRWLRDKIVDGLYVLVWEVQKTGAPHIHIMFRLQGDEHIVDMYSSMRAEWHKILLDVSRTSKVNLLTTDPKRVWMVLPSTVNCNYKVVNHDYAAYISKYMSKAQSKADGKFAFRPGRWWGLSDPLRKLVMERRFEQVFEISGPEKFAQFIDSLCARGFNLFDRLICFPKREIVRPDVYSFECSSGTGKEVAVAVAAWCLFGDITELEVLESGRKKTALRDSDRQKNGITRGARKPAGGGDAVALRQCKKHDSGN
jgi:hypothetical protein